MPSHRKYPNDILEHEQDAPFDQEDENPSKSQRKRDVEHLQALGEKLVELDASALKRFSLPENVFDALIEAKRITAHGARRRQFQYIGRLMRDVDGTSIEAQLDAFQDGSQARKRYDKLIEGWRDRLLSNENAAALTELQNNFPAADIGQLARLSTQAQLEQRTEKTPPKAYRQLYRELKALMPFSLLEESSDKD